MSIANNGNGRIQVRTVVALASAAISMLALAIMVHTSVMNQIRETEVRMRGEFDARIVRAFERMDKVDARILELQRQIREVK